VASNAEIACLCTSKKPRSGALTRALSHRRLSFPTHQDAFPYPGAKLQLKSPFFACVDKCEHELGGLCCLLDDLIYYCVFQRGLCSGRLVLLKGGGAAHGLLGLKARPADADVTARPCPVMLFGPRRCLYCVLCTGYCVLVQIQQLYCRGCLPLLGRCEIANYGLR
jgi:hypothetical protein